MEDPLLDADLLVNLLLVVRYIPFDVNVPFHAFHAVVAHNPVIPAAVPPLEVLLSFSFLQDRQDRLGYSKQVLWNPLTMRLHPVYHYHPEPPEDHPQLYYPRSLLPALNPLEEEEVLLPKMDKNDYHEMSRVMPRAIHYAPDADVVNTSPL